MHPCQSVVSIRRTFRFRKLFCHDQQVSKHCSRVASCERKSGCRGGPCYSKCVLVVFRKRRCGSRSGCLRLDGLSLGCRARIVGSNGKYAIFLIPTVGIERNGQCLGFSRRNQVQSRSGYRSTTRSLADFNAVRARVYSLQPTVTSRKSGCRTFKF